MQGHAVTYQQHIVENQQEQSNILAAINEKLEGVLERLDHIVENHSNLDQILHTFAACFDDSSTHSLASDRIEFLKPMIPMPIPAFATA